MPNICCDSDKIVVLKKKYSKASLVPEKTVYDGTALHEVGNTPEYPPKISAQSLYLKNLGKIYENLHRNRVSKHCLDPIENLS